VEANPKMSNPSKDSTEDELTAEADAGLRGQGALVEAIHRLKHSINAFSASSDQYSRRMWWLTIILAVLAFIQAISPVIQVIKLLSP
jgi:hypothetical protein